MADTKELWWLLAGAVISSDAVRKEAFTAIKPDDAPRELQGLFQAAWEGDAAKVRTALSIGGVPEDKVIDTVVQVVLLSVRRRRIKSIAANLQATANGDPAKFVAELHLAMEALGESSK